MLQKKQLQKINVNVSALIISSYKKIQNINIYLSKYGSFSTLFKIQYGSFLGRI